MQLYHNKYIRILRQELSLAEIWNYYDGSKVIIIIKCDQHKIKILVLNSSAVRTIKFYLEPSEKGIKCPVSSWPSNHIKWNIYGAIKRSRKLKALNSHIICEYLCVSAWSDLVKIYSSFDTGLMTMKVSSDPGILVFHFAL